MAIPNPKWIVAGKQVILKEDFVALEDGILTQDQARMQPPLVYVSATAVRVEATADSPISMQFTGTPNVLNVAAQVSGGLSDNKIRTVTANVSMDLASGGLYGTTQTEKVSQWYGIYALADDVDTDFVLQAIPLMRVKSQASQTISLGTLITPATGIGYGFTTDDALLVGGKIYFLTGASKGLMRIISANNNDDGTGGTITYSGVALSVAAGDWFFILPPTNFRLVGSVFNNSSGNIAIFDQIGNQVCWRAPLTIAAPTTTPTEDVTCAPPWALSLGVLGDIGTNIGHPEGTNYIEMGAITYAPTLTYYQRTTPVTLGEGTYNLWQHDDGATHDQAITLNPTYLRTFVETPIKNCKYKGAGAALTAIYYKNPPGCGY
jgi:hypothetical protein